MKNNNLSLKTIIIFCAGLVFYSLVFINDAAAPPPPPPPPPSVPATGDTATVVLIGAVGLYAAIRLLNKGRD